MSASFEQFLTLTESTVVISDHAAHYLNGQERVVTQMSEMSKALNEVAETLAASMKRFIVSWRAYFRFIINVKEAETLKGFMKIIGFIVGVAAVLDIQQKGLGYQMLPAKAQQCLTKIFSK